MGKWIKRTVVLGMAAAIFVLCCSCSLVRDFDVLMGGMQSAASTRAPRLNELPELPAPAQQGEEEAMPENTPLPSLNQDTTTFDTLVDTEGLLSGKNAVTLSEIISGALYVEQEDGTYLKETPFMGKDGGIILGFGQDGKNNYIDYFYTGEIQSVTAEKIVKELEVLTSAVEQKYGRANLHLWAMSPTGFDTDMSLVGEFTLEEISDAVTRSMYAGFQYTWRRVGGSLAYVTLFLDGQGNYSVDFIYDNTQSGAYGSFDA
ncbi:hypothetical protein CE91St36_03700 [Christensenellaceae bacterium]|nr:hypothetical protein CE91St36_03700 [Christensenellaceae bacterium]BDF60221.1 hypothetical protein CE91St37_03710 [Christensenellaceae bacterium]